MSWPSVINSGDYRYYQYYYYCHLSYGKPSCSNTLLQLCALLLPWWKWPRSQGWYVGGQKHSWNPARWMDTDRGRPWWARPIWCTSSPSTLKVRQLLTWDAQPHSASPRLSCVCVPSPEISLVHFSQMFCQLCEIIHLSNVSLWQLISHTWQDFPVVLPPPLPGYK